MEKKTVKADPHFKLESIGDIADLLFHSVQHHPNTVNAVNALDPRVLRDCVRKNDRRPASITIALPDSLAKNINGKAKLRDVYLLIRVPRHVADDWANPSLIVRPAQGIITP